ncbi:MAG: flagellar hook-basal body complex protein [Roseburia sp.]|jgi:flagellar hook protein FlgE|nr:flagellar hook-basal body complex protein [Roseburia sp.]
MMRSMYSAVSGLKTHQTRMDVIGNNIANVNTVAFKSSSVTFQDILYQNTSGASGANATTGTGGINAKQIGLGVSTGATNISITNPGAAETTGGAFDVRLSDQTTTNFFIVSTGTENLFTRSGSFYVDGAGNLCMTSTGYTVMGWQVDPTTGLIRKDTVSPLRVMQPSNMTSPPEATTKANASGIVDKFDTDVVSDSGLVKNLSFYDKLGYSYTARFLIKDNGETMVNGQNCKRYTVELEKILDSDGNNITENFSKEDMGKIFGNFDPNTVFATYESATNHTIDPVDGSVEIPDPNNPGGKIKVTHDATNKCFVDAGGNQYKYTTVLGISTKMQGMIDSGEADLTFNASYMAPGATTAAPVYQVIGPSATYDLNFSAEDGTFVGINGLDAVNLNLSGSGLFPDGNFENIEIDFSKLQNTNNGGKSTAVIDAGAVDDAAEGVGKKLGALIGLSIDNSGKIWGTYDNGNTTVLGQIAVAQFANAAGLEKVGDNCYTTTLNSGEFDGIGVEIDADGSKMTSGELEMSNVDLASEFTSMITTQRGFQANSRTITTSDTLLEELINLKR